MRARSDALTAVRRHRSSAVPLAALYAALVVYASLYPFTGWRHPLGLASLAAYSLPWPHRWTAFDVVANLLGYLPLGALVCAGLVRSGYGVGRGPGNHWLHAKLALVVATLLYHHHCGRILRDCEQLKNRRTDRWLRGFNETAVVFFTLIVVLVVVKPF